jgi:hypothetical protein
MSHAYEYTILKFQVSSDKYTLNILGSLQWLLVQFEKLKTWYMCMLLNMLNDYIDMFCDYCSEEEVVVRIWPCYWNHFSKMYLAGCARKCFILPYWKVVVTNVVRKSSVAVTLIQVDPPRVSRNHWNTCCKRTTGSCLMRIKVHIYITI